MNTEDFISALSQDAKVRWPLSRSLAVAVTTGIVLAGTAFFAGVGVRPDFGQAAETGRFLFKFVVTITAGAAAVGLAARLARPGARPGWWSVALALPAVLLAAAVVFELAVMPEATWMTRLIGVNARHCLTLIPLLAMMPLTCLLLAMRQGAPLHPGLAGAVAGLAASAIAATFYASSCTDDSPLFVITWYSIATAIVVLVGYVAGSKFLRW